MRERIINLIDEHLESIRFANLTRYDDPCRHKMLDAQKTILEIFKSEIEELE